MNSWQIVSTLALVAVAAGFLVILNAARAQRFLKVVGIGAGTAIAAAAVTLAGFSITEALAAAPVQTAIHRGAASPAKTVVYRPVVTPVTPAAAPAKEPVPEWKGDLMKRKWHERGELMKKKWAERKNKN